MGAQVEVWLDWFYDDVFHFSQKAFSKLRMRKSRINLKSNIKCVCPFPYMKLTFTVSALHKSSNLWERCLFAFNFMQFIVVSTIMYANLHWPFPSSPFDLMISCLSCTESVGGWLLLALQSCYSTCWLCWYLSYIRWLDYPTSQSVKTMRPIIIKVRLIWCI